MSFQYNDGGRSAAGYKGHAQDCVVRAIAIATQIPYQQVYDAINIEAKSERVTSRMRRRSSSRSGTYRKTYEKFLAKHGWKWTPTMKIGGGCKVHLDPAELPAGRLIVRVAGHLTSMIDGVINDTYDPNDRGVWFRQFPGWQTADLKQGEQRNQNGIFSTAKRCVYGYYSKEEA